MHLQKPNHYTALLLGLAVEHIRALLEVRNKDDVSEAEVLLTEHFAQNFLDAYDANRAAEVVLDEVPPPGHSLERG